MGSESREALEDQGFVATGSILDRCDAQRLFEAFHSHLGPSPERNDYGILRNDIWRKIPLFRSKLDCGRLGRLACELLGSPEVILFQDNVIEKPAHHSSEVQWHQDYAYWPLDRPHGITLWVALSPAGRHSGCLHYLPGTHRQGERQGTDFMPRTGQPRDPNLRPMVIPVDARPVACPLLPGEVIAHHPLTWHMSPGNETDQARCGWSLTFLHPEVRWAPTHAPHPLNYWHRPQPGARLCTEHFPRIQLAEA